MAKLIEFEAPDLIKEIEVEITVTKYRRAEIRLKISMLILRFAIWIGGFGGFEVICPDEPESMARLKRESDDEQRE